jgi:hypothetical protein
MKNRLISSLAVLLLAMLGAIGATAQVDISPGVARVSLLQGDVSTQRGDSGQWDAAVLNAPIVSGDKLSTGDNARAEVQLDFANILRLGDHSQAIFATLTRNQIQVQVSEGIANYDVFQGNETAAEVDTPNVAIHPGRDGASFRVIVNSGDESQIIIRRGSVQIATAQGSTRADQGQMITVHGTGDDTAYKSEDAPPADDWDSWISERDNKIQNAKSWGHTDRYYTGSEDLDSYGQWKNSPDYGQVWVPAVSADWAPYRDGRWVWEPYYGWTWVAGEPWGWAPYHYGRWFYADNAWAWWPGPVAVTPYYRPIWAPAYVSFFGFGGGGFGVSAGFGLGSFGWLPLGPGDDCHPWWGGYRDRFGERDFRGGEFGRRGDEFGRRGGEFGGRGGEFGGIPALRANGFSNLRMAETNEHIRQGVSAVPAGSFGTGRAGARPVDAATFRQGHVMTGNLPVVPSRESLSASNRPASSSTVRNGVSGRFFSNSNVRPASVESFDHQASQVQQSIQRDNHFTPVRSGEQLNARNETPGSVRSSGSVRPSVSDISPVSSRGVDGKPSAGIRPETNGSTNQRNTNTNGGFTRFGSPQAQDRNSGNEQPRSEPASGQTHNNNVPRPGQNNQPQSSRPASSDQSGWHRFSDSGNAGSGNTRGSVRPDTSSPRSVPRPPSSSNPASERSITRTNPAPRSPQSNYGGGSGDYRPFSSAPRSSGPSNTYPRSSGPSNSYPRNFGSSNSYPSNQGPRGSSPQLSNRGFGGGGAPPRAPSQGPAFSRGPAPGPSGNRSFGSPSYAASSRSYSRPPLDMRQPIVGGRSSGGYPSGGGYRGGGGNSGYHASGGSSRGSGGGGSSHSSSGHHR